MSSRQLAFGGLRIGPLLNLPITVASGPTGTTPTIGLVQSRYLAVQANFTYGSGGTSADAYVQTSLDGGLTWIDIMNFHFLVVNAIKVSAVTIATAVAPAITPTDGSLAANTILSGLIGDRIRVKYVTVGTYAGGTNLRLDAVLSGA